MASVRKEVIERRKRRSDDPVAALRYQLEYTREIGSLDAVLLADADGLLFAFAGELGVCEELGAYAPLFYQTVLGLRLPRVFEQGKVTVHPTRILGESMYLVVLGDLGRERSHVVNSARAIERILAPRRHVPAALRPN